MMMEAYHMNDTKVKTLYVDGKTYDSLYLNAFLDYHDLDSDLS